MRLHELIMVSGLLLSAPACAEQCTAQVHPGAMAYSFTDRGMDAISYDDPAPRLAVESIDRVTPGGPWILRHAEFYWRRSDVDLLGDCSQIQMVQAKLQPNPPRQPGMCGPYWRGFHPYYVHCTSF